MSRPRHSLSASQPESFNVRWHSVVDPATPSADIMSSPDPLNEATGVLDVVPPSSVRRVTRGSQRSQRFASPRKQTFELQVGDDRSPQKLLVTVETDEPVHGASSGPRRRLFQSPALSAASPAPRRRKERATTTTIPLRDSIEEEPVTPRRRGRPRKSNGTPMPSAAKRRAGTPAKARTPRRPRVANDDEPDAPRIEEQPTPRSTRRGRPPKNHAPEPPSDAATELLPMAPATRQSPRRRQAQPHEQLLELDQSAPELAAQSEDEMELVREPSNSSADAPVDDAPIDDGPDSDIWMATLSNEATPKASANPEPTLPAHSPLERTTFSRQFEPEQADPDVDTSQVGDYVDLVAAPSDVSSIDEPVSTSAPQNNDTIAQGEDFSMIFMDSIPSLQGFFNSSIPPVAQEELGEETNIIINNTLESLRQSTAQREEAAVSDSADHPNVASSRPDPAEDELASSELTPVQQRAKESPRQRSSPRLSRSPRKPAASSPLRHRVLRFTARQAEDSAAMPPADDVEVQTPRSSRTAKDSGQVDDRAVDLYEDSFSEIPQQVLTAATPKPHYAAEEYDDHDDMELVEGGETLENIVEELNLEREEETQPQEDTIYDEHEEGIRVQEEATYEGHQDHNEAAEIATRGGQDDLNQAQEAMALEVDGEYEEHEEHPAPSNASMTARSDAGRLPTPDDTPPQPEVQEDEEQDKSGPESVASPQPVSPLAARAGSTVADEEDLAAASHTAEPSGLRPSPGLGRASTHSIGATPTQQASSPLQEPLSLQQESLLDKTFRPALSAIVRAGRVLQSITSDPPSPEGRERQLGSPFRSSGSKESWNGSRDSQNSRRMSKSPQQLTGLTRRPSTTKSPAVDDPFASSSHHTGQANFMQALGRAAGGSGNNDPSPSRESAASSMRITPPSDDAMSWVVAQGPISPRLRGDTSLQQAASSSSTRAAKGTMSLRQLDDEADAPDELNQEEPETRDDETDIWDFEARRETPKQTRQRPFGKRVVTSNNRRGGLPSPWAKRAAQARSNLQHDEAKEASHEPPRLAGKGKGPAAAQASEADEFSMLSRTQQQEAADKEAESASKSKGFDLSSFFSSPAAIPGMLAQKFLPTTTRSIFGPTASQPEPAQAAAPVMPTSSMFPQLPQKEFRPNTAARKDLFSPTRAREPQERPPVEASSSPITPERIPLPVVAQKQNFTPRPRQASQTFFQGSAQSAAAAAAAASTPPRMQLSHADIHRWQQETSNASEGSTDLSVRPSLRPLPAKNASPIKSSLRSPLKPRTPGRVVEFTSSVLSPAEQARARLERRLSSSFLSQEQPQPQPQPQQQQSAPSAPPPAADDKENSNSDQDDVTMEDAPRIESTKQRPLPAALSRSVWTRQHWLFLDYLLQLRRRAPFAVGYEPRADRYLGKTVRSQGEAMRLERWHLDCVDAFKAEVGGWDEGVLAKRLFALILGEERRKRGAPARLARRSRVMFH